MTGSSRARGRLGEREAVSLLGCTPRRPSPGTFGADQVRRIQGVCAGVLAQSEPVTLSLRCVLAAVEALRDVPLGELTVSRVELAVTDFVVSPRPVRTLATFELA